MTAYLSWLLGPVMVPACRHNVLMPAWRDDACLLCSFLLAVLMPACRGLLLAVTMPACRDFMLAVVMPACCDNVCLLC